MNASTIREASLGPDADAETDACVALWVRACATRDGVAVEGVAERARGKFAARALLLLAGAPGGIEGFALATVPGSGSPGDPQDAAVLGLLAVAPEAQSRGVGRGLLRAATTRLAELGYPRVVLHVLEDNAVAVRLYEVEGWRPSREAFDHPLLGRRAQSYVLELSPPGNTP